MQIEILYIKIVKLPGIFLHRIMPGAYRRIFSLVLLTLLANVAIATESASDAERSDSSVVLKANLSMRCFPPNNPANTPPCPVPAGLDSSLIAPDPSGQLHIKVRENDTATFTLKLDGLKKGMVVTSWFVHFPPTQPAPHPIFAPTGPGLPSVALADSPLAATTARFSNGLSTEPNQIIIKNDGSGRIKAKLDYNPLKSNQVPLVNNMTPVNQALAPLGSVAEQHVCCVDFPSGPKMETVGGAYLRKFDPVTGFQLKDETGRPMLIRSPGRPVAVAVFVHIDGTTSGVLPGIPTPPFLVNPPATTGSFYLLGLFPLAALGMD